MEPAPELPNLAWSAASLGVVTTAEILKLDDILQVTGDDQT